MLLPTSITKQKNCLATPPKKSFTVNKKKKKYGYFTSNFNPFQCLNKTQKDRLALYLSYATLMTYVLVLGAEQFQFPLIVLFGEFLAKDEKTGVFSDKLSTKKNCVKGGCKK